MVLDEHLVPNPKSEVERDMNALIEACQSLLLYACSYSHDDKVKLVKELNKLIGKK